MSNEQKQTQLLSQETILNKTTHKSYSSKQRGFHFETTFTPTILTNNHKDESEQGIPYERNNPKINTAKEFEAKCRRFASLYNHALNKMHSPSSPSRRKLRGSRHKQDSESTTKGGKQKFVKPISSKIAQKRRRRRRHRILGKTKKNGRKHNYGKHADPEAEYEDDPGFHEGEGEYVDEPAAYGDEEGVPTTNDATSGKKDPDDPSKSVAIFPDAIAYLKDPSAPYWSEVPLEYLYLQVLNWYTARSLPMTTSVQRKKVLGGDQAPIDEGDPNYDEFDDEGLAAGADEYGDYDEQPEAADFLSCSSRQYFRHRRGDLDLPVLNISKPYKSTTMSKRRTRKRHHRRQSRNTRRTEKGIERRSIIIAANVVSASSLSSKTTQAALTVLSSATQKERNAAAAVVAMAQLMAREESMTSVIEKLEKIMTDMNVYGNTRRTCKTLTKRRTLTKECVPVVIS